MPIFSAPDGEAPELRGVTYRPIHTELTSAHRTLTMKTSSLAHRTMLLGSMLLASINSATSGEEHAHPAVKPGEVITNSIGQKLVLIPAGSFTMGSPAGEPGHKDDEGQHRVTLTKPFYLGTTEVTQAQWTAVMGTKPWQGHDVVKEGADYAASHIDWEDATEFCRVLSATEGKTYRLPTEAEWEYACRAGSTAAYSFGDDASRLSDYAWWGGLLCEGNAKLKPYAHQVGQKRPNAFGLYDMHGNVSEWCSDWYGEKYYKTSIATDPPGPVSGSYHVIRGDSWRKDPAFCRASARNHLHSPSLRSTIYGFRVVLER